jgi:hypothetical protein
LCLHRKRSLWLHAFELPARRASPRVFCSNPYIFAARVRRLYAERAPQY